MLNDFVFHQISLTQLIEDYKNSGTNKNDSNGKKLYEIVDSELRARNKNRSEIIEMIVEYLIENKDTQVQKIVNFLRKQFE